MVIALLLLLLIVQIKCFCPMERQHKIQVNQKEAGFYIYLAQLAVFKNCAILN